MRWRRLSNPSYGGWPELHFFGGLTFDEIADFLKIGRSTVFRDIRMAQSWLENYVTA